MIRRNLILDECGNTKRICQKCLEMSFPVNLVLSQSLFNEMFKLIRMLKFFSLADNFEMSRQDLPLADWQNILRGNETSENVKLPNEIKTVSEDLCCDHLWVGASVAIKGLIVFTWLQDNADDARASPSFATSSSLMQHTKSLSSRQTWRKNQLKIGAQICQGTIAGWIESFCVKCYRRLQSVRQIALSSI